MSEESTRESAWTWLIAVAAGFLVFAGYRFLAKNAGEGVQKKLPPIAAAGWFNGTEVTSHDLAGRVVVIDAWASW